MKVIYNWGDLKQYGINCLTGEACGISARALCDLTKDGAALVREFFGLPYNSTFQESWNTGSEFSCFLPWSVLPDLAAFALITRDNLGMAVQTRDGIYAPEDSDSDEDWQKWLEFESTSIVRQYRPLNAPRKGLSCTHQMSGRAQ